MASIEVLYYWTDDRVRRCSGMCRALAANRLQTIPKAAPLIGLLSHGPGSVQRQQPPCAEVGDILVDFHYGAGLTHRNVGTLPGVSLPLPDHSHRTRGCPNCCPKRDRQPRYRDRRYYFAKLSGARPSDWAREGD